MEKHTYFDTYWGKGWPELKWLEPYFLTSEGRRRFFSAGNDSWGLGLDGVDDTEHLLPFKGRIDINLTILGHPDLGILLGREKRGPGVNEAHYSKGNLMRLREWVKTLHGDRMPVGLFVPFDTAWKGVKEFIERDGALPASIEWVAAADLPAGTFPPP
jgi:hypothetical protein